MKNKGGVLSVVVLIFVAVIAYSSLVHIRNSTNSTPAEPNFTDQVQTLLDSCGVIANGTRYGSCVAVAPDLLLTAGHCIDYLGGWIEIQDVRYKIVEQWASEDHDVGFVRIDGALPYIELGQMPDLLDTVYLVGTPHDPAFVNVVTKGIICKVNLQYSGRVVDWTGSFICDAMAWRGNSGGPAMNERGQIVGIYVGLFLNVDNFSVCVPVDVIRAALAEYYRAN